MENSSYFFVAEFTEKNGSRDMEWYEIVSTSSGIAFWKAWAEAMKVDGRSINCITEVVGIRSMQDLTDLVAFGINPEYPVHYHLHLFHEED